MEFYIVFTEEQASLRLIVKAWRSSQPIKILLAYGHTNELSDGAGPMWPHEEKALRRVSALMAHKQLFVFLSNSPLQKLKKVSSFFLMTKMGAFSQVCVCGWVGQPGKGKVGRPVCGALWNPGIRSPTALMGLFLSLPAPCVSVLVAGAPGPPEGRVHCSRHPPRNHQLLGEQRGHSCTQDEERSAGRNEIPGSWSNGHCLWLPGNHLHLDTFSPTPSLRLGRVSYEGGVAESCTVSEHVWKHLWLPVSVTALPQTRSVGQMMSVSCSWTVTQAGVINMSI